MAYHRKLPTTSDRTGLLVMASIFCVTTITVVWLRFYARKLTRIGVGPDDWLALASMFFVLALNGIFIGGTAKGAITGHSPVVDNWPVTTPLEHLAQKYKYGFQVVEKVAFALIKLSLLFLWKRMLTSIRWFQVFCWTMIAVVTAWAISFFFATVFQCGTHWDWNWAPISWFLTECTNSLNMLTVFTATDLVTDFIIIIMPVPVIWRLHMPTRKKIGVTSIFLVGFFTIGAGIARMYIYLVTSYDKEDNPDFIADFTLFILWSEIEVNVGMIVCCMPILGPVLGRCRDYVIVLTQSMRLGYSSASNPSHKIPWRGGVHTTAGPGDRNYEDLEAQSGLTGPRILARTEISNTYE
ncbi:hypothetical protein BDV25DRAFT_126613 [Aspergillus avenaceus]|uniref:Rhodopsin domain-containing protein n=1 Tax=Aspergillus avenaceus TaxID=36643 RepID=A0A5N6U895_ASPAV|nr:hypothetical protein BDV25DRAFT_126613 [Aspergillus avenaceus]